MATLDDKQNRAAARLTAQQFESELLAVAAEHYHDKHPFHRMLQAGELSREQLQAWALNRYCFQNAVAQKDALVISRIRDFELRREWTLRLLDHDGFGEDPGGIGRFLVLTDALGLDRAFVRSMSGALPATQFAVQAYIDFARERSLVAVIASSLTELLAPKLHRERFAGMLDNYGFLNSDALTYFKRRLTHAPRDASFALDFVYRHAPTFEQQMDCVAAFRFKCQILWAQLDALYLAYVLGQVPPGAFRLAAAPTRANPET